MLCQKVYKAFFFLFSFRFNVNPHMKATIFFQERVGRAQHLDPAEGQQFKSIVLSCISQDRKQTLESKSHSYICLKLHPQMLLNTSPLLLSE